MMTISMFYIIISTHILSSHIVYANDINQHEYSYYDKDRNVIKNNCKFDVLRFQKNDIICNDYGKNKKYCNHYSIPNEFLVYNEKGINNKKTIKIKPYAMWEIYNEKVNKMANFNYNFICNNITNQPKLTLNIIPSKKYDKSLSDEIMEVMAGLIIIVILFSIIGCCCNLVDYDINKKYNNNFMNGLIIGNMFSQSSNNYRNRKVYCQ